MAPTKRSLIWWYMTVSAIDSSKALCSVCNASISRGGKVGKKHTTTNLINHLRKHKHQYVEYVKAVLAESEKNNLLDLSGSSHSIQTHNIENTSEISQEEVVLQMPQAERYKFHHDNHLSLVLKSLAEDESFMDVTLTAQGKAIKAHKSVLSAVSPYFRRVLKANPCQHPVIIMPRDIKFEELNNIIKYVYKGELTVAAEEISSLLKTGEVLQVVGLINPSKHVGAHSDNLFKQTETLPSELFTVKPLHSSHNDSSIFKTPSKNSVIQGAPSESNATPTKRVPSESNATPPEVVINSESQSRLKPVSTNSNTIYIKEEVTCKDEEIESFSAPSADNGSSVPSNHASTSRENSASMDSSDTNVIDVPINDLSCISALYPALQENNPEAENDNKIFNPDNSLSTTLSKVPQESSASLPYVCPYCFESHRPKKALQIHLRLKHPSKPSFLCDCGKVFIKQILLVSHKKECKS